MKGKILVLLREREDYVSGQELCERFGVSRTAVWKAIKSLKEEGYRIEAVPNKGYLLMEEDCRDFFGAHEIESRLDTVWAGKPLHFYEETDSTNVRAKLAAEQGEVNGALFVADKQTAGRGRRGRSWESPAGGNIYFTLLLRPEFSPDSASMLTLVAAMAVTAAVKEVLGKEMVAREALSKETLTQETLGKEMLAREASEMKVGIKWPNDVVIEGKKVCGILTEMSTEPEHIQYVVIGVGINAGHQELPEEIAKNATSLEDCLGHKVNRSLFLARIMKHFEAYYECFLKTCDMEGLLKEYNEMLINKGRLVKVLDPKGEYEGTAEGIDPQGELLVRTAEGTQKVYAGEVSVRGIYGYV